VDVSISETYENPRGFIDEIIIVRYVLNLNFVKTEYELIVLRNYLFKVFFVGYKPHIVRNCIETNDERNKSLTIT